MKKILVLAALLTVGMISCKKEETAQPSAKIEKGVMQGEKKDLGSWD